MAFFDDYLRHRLPRARTSLVTLQDIASTLSALIT
jgi:hypothetical protein